MADDVADRDGDPPFTFQRGHQVPVATNPHRFSGRLIDRRHHRRRRPPVQIEQVFLKVDGDALLPLHQPQTFKGRLRHLGCPGECIQFGGFKLARGGPQQSEGANHATIVAAQRLADAGPDVGRGFVHDVVVALRQLQGIADDHRLAGIDDVDRHQRRVECGTMVSHIAGSTSASTGSQSTISSSPAR